jgi:hypothetical protein
VVQPVDRVGGCSEDQQNSAPGARLEEITELLGYDPELPPQLAEALIEFGAWSQAQLLAEQDASTPKEPLYHYTGEASVRGILSTQRLWCFRHLHQSDETEFDYSLAIARNVIRELFSSTDFFTRHFGACLDDLLDTNGLAGPFEFYLFSLSRHRDDPEQWWEYGQSGTGYAIGFAPSLLQPDRNHLDENPTKNLHVGRVIYGDAATAERHRQVVRCAAEITSRIGNANVEAVRGTGPARYLVSVARELLASQLVWNCLTAKDQRFANEREVRGIILNLKDRFDPYRRTLGLRHYVEHELPLRATNAIAEILVGPEAPQGAEALVTDILHYSGYPDGAVPVVRSACRGPRRAS